MFDFHQDLFDEDNRAVPSANDELASWHHDQSGYSKAEAVLFRSDELEQPRVHVHTENISSRCPTIENAIIGSDLKSEMDLLESRKS